MMIPMPFTVFLALLMSCIVIALTPGAGAVNSMATSLRSGWARTGWTVLGQELALGVQLLITALGVGFLIAQHPDILLAIKIIGALYLAYLGLRLLLEKPQAASSHMAALPAQSNWELIRRGFIVNITNPKAILFFGAIFAQFAHLGWVAAPVMVLTGTIWFVGFALAVQTMSKLITKYSKLIDVITGSIFIALAVWMLWEGLHFGS